MGGICLLRRHDGDELFRRPRQTSVALHRSATWPRSIQSPRKQQRREHFRVFRCRPILRNPDADGSARRLQQKHTGTQHQRLSQIRLPRNDARHKPPSTRQRIHIKTDQGNGAAKPQPASPAPDRCRRLAHREREIPQTEHRGFMASGGNMERMERGRKPLRWHPRRISDQRGTQGDSGLRRRQVHYGDSGSGNAVALWRGVCRISHAVMHTHRQRLFEFLCRQRSYVWIHSGTSRRSTWNIPERIHPHRRRRSPQRAMDRMRRLP